jgi:molybdopterin-synthase adenylyltransferase
VLGPIVNIVASFQAAEAFKILTGQLDRVNRELVYIDVWENITRRIKVAPLLGKVDCPCCGRRRFEWLEGEQGSQTTSLCGRNAVQVAHRLPAKLNFEEMARHLGAMGGAVSFNRFLLKFSAESYEFTVFPDGRAIIKGTSDLERARVLYAKYIGH